MNAQPTLYTLKTKFPFGISRSVTSELPTVLFRIGDAGQGEGSPVRYKGQKAEDIAAALADLGRGLTADNLDDIDGHDARARRAYPHLSSALAAFNIALWDARGRRAGKPVHELLGTPRPTLKTTYTVSLSDHDTMELRAREAAHLPFLKIKLGRDEAFDLEAMRRIRAAAPKAVLRVDANAGWSREVALSIIPKLADLGVEFVEQPLAIGDYEGLARLHRESPLPIIADEDAQDVASLEALRGRVAGINIKLMKCGGISEALRMIAFARREGWSILVGCMIETRLGLGAGAHVCGLVDYADLDAHLLTANDPFPPGSAQHLSADLPLGSGPGIGLPFFPLPEPTVSGAASTHSGAVPVSKKLAMEKMRVVHLAEGKFSLRNSKMTTGVLRYGYHDSVAVIDSTKVGQTAEQVIGFGGPVPVVASLEDALKFKPQAMLIGITPPGGRLPEDMRQTVLKAIGHGLHVWAGLHDFLEDDAEIVAAAKKAGVGLWDIRRPGKNLPVGGGLARWSKSYISLMVGSDCAIGKMTVALEIDRAAKKSGIKTEFIATGQCGIAIAGWGSPIDAIPGDFMAGCVERDVMTVDGEAEIILVEGQGSLLHPGFSSVTLSLLHGAIPHSLILCHQTTRKEISNIKDVPIPSLDQVIQPYIDLASPFRKPHFIGVSLNTSGTSEAEARAAIADAERVTGVPATDPVRFGAEKLVEALQEHRRKMGK